MTHSDLHVFKVRPASDRQGRPRVTKVPKRVFEGMMEASQIVRDPVRKGSATTYLLHPDFRPDTAEDPPPG